MARLNLGPGQLDLVNLVVGRPHELTLRVVDEQGDDFAPGAATLTVWAPDSATELVTIDGTITTGWIVFDLSELTLVVGHGLYRHEVVADGRSWLKGTVDVRSQSDARGQSVTATTGEIIVEYATPGSGGGGSMTAAEILAALLTVDGTGSGLDADLLDGQSSAAFATSGHTHSGTYDPAGTAAGLFGTEATAREVADTALDERLDTLEAISIATDTELAAAISAHAAAADPHPTYLTAAEGAASFDALGAGTTAAASAVATHEADTTGVHGIADTSALVTTSDARLSDARTPTAHATSHRIGGTDAIKLDDLAAPDDNTDLNATTSAHGLLPKLGGGTTNFLRADGTWNAPSGGGGSVATDAIFDVVGDLVVGTGADTAARLALGTTGQILGIGGSTKTAAWHANFGAAVYGASVYVAPVGMGAPDTGSGASVATETWYWPIYVPRRATLDALQIQIDTSEAGSSVRVGIYSANKDLAPAVLVADYGSLSGASTGLKTATGSTALEPGWYCLCTNVSNHAAVRPRRFNQRSTWTPLGLASAAASVYYMGYKGSTLHDDSAGLPSSPRANAVSSGSTSSTAVVARFTDA